MLESLHSIISHGSGINKHVNSHIIFELHNIFILLENSSVKENEQSNIIP